MKCIYCQKNSPEVTFTSKEHVVPKFMGIFINNITLIGLVCDTCNSNIFSQLEIKFIEDTEEGIRQQMFNFRDSNQIRIRGDKVVRTITKGLNIPMFNEMFPLLKLQNGLWKLALVPQIKIKHYGKDGYVILFIDKILKINKNSKKFSNLKSLLGDAKSKDVNIFVGQNEDGSEEKTMEETISFVKDLGIDYKEGKRESVDSKEIEGTYYEYEMDCRIDSDIGRVIAKIAFNYFAYCVKKEGLEEILFHPNFYTLKDYIMGKVDIPIKQIIPSIQSTPIIIDEKMRGENVRLLGHLITFRQENNNLISEISFLGSKIYKIILGEIPNELKNKNIGCGHLFNPMDHKISQLTQNMKKWGSGQEDGFGLFKLT